MISQHEFTALSWLHGKLGLDSEDINLYYLIGNLREGKYGLYYNCYEIDGRPIWQPKGELKVVQKAISQKLLPMFPRHRSCFGFSGGNCRQVAEKHLGFKSVLMFDLRYAFRRFLISKCLIPCGDIRNQGCHFMRLGWWRICVQLGRLKGLSPPSTIRLHHPEEFCRRAQPLVLGCSTFACLRLMTF